METKLKTHSKKVLILSMMFFFIFLSLNFVFANTYNFYPADYLGYPVQGYACYPTHGILVDCNGGNSWFDFSGSSGCEYAPSSSYNDHYVFANENLYTFQFSSWTFNTSSLDLDGQYVSDVRLYIKAQSTNYPFVNQYVKRFSSSNLTSCTLGLSESADSFSSILYNYGNYVTLTGSSRFGEEDGWGFASLGPVAISDITNNPNYFSIGLTGSWPSDGYSKILMYDFGSSYLDDDIYLQVVTSDIPIDPPVLEESLPDVHVNSYSSANIFLPTYFSGYFGYNSSMYSNRFSWTYGNFTGYVGDSEWSDFHDEDGNFLFSGYIDDNGYLNLGVDNIPGNYNIQVCANNAGGSTCDNFTLFALSTFDESINISLEYEEHYILDWEDLFPMIDEFSDWSYEFLYFRDYTSDYIYDNYCSVFQPSESSSLEYPDEYYGQYIDYGDPLNTVICDFGWDWSAPINTVDFEFGRHHTDGYYIITVTGCENSSGGGLFCLTKNINICVTDDGICDFDGSVGSTGSNTSIINIGIINNIYPDSETLTSKQKFSYIVVSVFVVVFGIGVFFFVSKSKNPRPFVYLALILSLALIGLFVSIDYIGVGFIIVLVLLILLLLFLFRGSK